MSKKILVIEDEEAVRNSLVELLRLLGYEAVAGNNGAEGLRLAREEQPDLIICDIMMPEMDGYAVLRELNKDSLTSTIPFIFLTAKTALGDIRRGMEAGADDYLFKPFSMNDLTKAIDVRFAKRQQLMSKYAEEESPAVKKTLQMDSHIILMSNNHPESLKLEKIVVIEALEHYCSIFTSEGKKLLVRKAMKDWESLLPEGHFIRVHRSTIINLNYVIRFESWFNNTFRVYLLGKQEPYDISRRYGSRLRARVNMR